MSRVKHEHVCRRGRMPFGSGRTSEGEFDDERERDIPQLALGHRA